MGLAAFNRMRRMKNDEGQNKKKSLLPDYENMTDDQLKLYALKDDIDISRIKSRTAIIKALIKKAQGGE